MDFSDELRRLAAYAVSLDTLAAKHPAVADDLTRLANGVRAQVESIEHRLGVDADDDEDED